MWRLKCAPVEGHGCYWCLQEESHSEPGTDKWGAVERGSPTGNWQCLRTDQTNRLLVWAIGLSVADLARNMRQSPRYMHHFQQDEEILWNKGWHLPLWALCPVTNGILDVVEWIWYLKRRLPWRRVDMSSRGIRKSCTSKVFTVQAAAGLLWRPRPVSFSSELWLITCVKCSEENLSFPQLWPEASGTYVLVT